MRRSSRLGFDHYQTLGVAYNASRVEIRNAFLRKAKSYHPDINPGDVSAVRKFQRVAEAHSVLSQEDTKKAYDRQIGNIPRLPFEAGGSLKRQRVTVKAPRPPPGTKIFDFETWNDWHYGDSGYSRNGTEQVHDSEERAERERNPHAAFFDRQNLRSQQARQEAQAINSQRNQRDDIVKRLRERRAKRSAAAASGGLHGSQYASRHPSSSTSAEAAQCSIS